MPLALQLLLRTPSGRSWSVVAPLEDPEAGFRRLPVTALPEASGTDPGVCEAAARDLAVRCLGDEASGAKFEQLGRLSALEHGPAPAGETEFWGCAIATESQDPNFFRWSEIAAEHRALRCLLWPETQALLETGQLPEAPPRTVHALSGIVQLPLRTPTLPPALHTNTYLVGERIFWVVDPAPYDQTEIDLLIAAIEQRLSQGHLLAGFLLTHHHADHIGALSALVARWRRPIGAHPNTAARLGLEDYLPLGAGDRLELGPDANGSDFVIELWHTPGHAPGHLVLVDRRPNSGAMVVGDMVAGTGTILIDPSDGDMTAYLRSLETMRRAGPRLLFPAHGLPIPNGTAKLSAYLAHRTAREAKIQRALDTLGLCTLAELVRSAYDDTPASSHPLAARAALAHLEKLAKDGRAEALGDRWRSA